MTTAKPSGWGFSSAAYVTMKWKRFLKWSALAILLILFGWFQFAYWTSTNDCGRSIPSGSERMKAIRYCEYGSPDVLKVDGGREAGAQRE